MAEWSRHACLLCLSAVVLHLFMAGTTVTQTGANPVLSVAATSLSHTGNFKSSDCRNISVSLGRFCAQDTKLADYILSGIKKGIFLCQKIFQNCRWNCTTFLGEHLFGEFVTDYNPQRAFIVSSNIAAIVKTVAEGCRHQNFDECPCFSEEREHFEVVKGDTTFTYKCDENVPWSVEIASRFTRAGRSDPIDEHNKQVSIKLMTESVDTFCSCIGVSGSCLQQKCYRKSAGLSAIGEQLKELYKSAVKVVQDGSQLFKVPPPNSDSLPDQELELASNDKLVYTNYTDLCNLPPESGILSVSGRQCTKDGPNTCGSCSSLCCGRETYPDTVTVETECCNFVWCCDVVCRPCTDRPTKTESIFRCR